MSKKSNCPVTSFVWACVTVFDLKETRSRISNWRNGDEEGRGAIPGATVSLISLLIDGMNERKSCAAAPSRFFFSLLYSRSTSSSPFVPNLAGSSFNHNNNSSSIFVFASFLFRHLSVRSGHQVDPFIIGYHIDTWHKWICNVLLYIAVVMMRLRRSFSLDFVNDDSATVFLHENHEEPSTSNGHSSSSTQMHKQHSVSINSSSLKGVIGFVEPLNWCQCAIDLRKRVPRVTI